MTGCRFVGYSLSLFNSHSACLPAYCFMPFIFLINNLSNEKLRRSQSQAKTTAKLITMESGGAKAAARIGGAAH